MKTSDLISLHFRLTESQKKALKKLQLESVEDLLFHFPTRYESIEDIKNIKDLEKDDQAIVYGKISGLQTKKSFKS